MRSDDVFAGSAFKASALAVAIMAVAFAIAGTLAHQTVRRAMYSELERELVEEILLFEEVYNTGGERALTDAVRKLEAPEIVGKRYVALIDASGVRLAGNLDVTPAFLRLTRTIEIVPTSKGETIAAGARKFDTVQLVVGRNTKLIDATLRTLDYALLGAFLLIFVAALIAGWVMSRRSMAKLARISETLERVSRGDTAARIGATNGDEQVDRISRLIDSSLARLTALTESSQNTIRSIAHDLRTPLNRTAIRLEEAQSAPESMRERLIADAQDELVKLGSIFDTVLRISSLETSFDRNAFVDVDLSATVAETVALFEADFAERHQNIEMAADEPVIVHGDRQALRQLLVNLLANANRHTGENTKIIVRARRGDAGAVLEVCDDGPGIAADQRSTVLKPFTRLDASRTVEGTGLGLALVNAIAIRHGATLELGDNDPGLCVRVTFPS